MNIYIHIYVKENNLYVQKLKKNILYKIIVMVTYS